MCRIALIAGSRWADRNTSQTLQVRHFGEQTMSLMLMETTANNKGGVEEKEEGKQSKKAKQIQCEELRRRQ